MIIIWQARFIYIYIYIFNHLKKIQSPHQGIQLLIYIISNDNISEGVCDWVLTLYLSQRDRKLWTLMAGSTKILSILT